MAQTGVGLTLAPHAQSSALRVTAFDPEGPAARGGLIQLGDILYEVDDTSIVGLNGEQVKTLILGAPGSPVTLGLRRQNGRLFYVRIQRAQPKGGAAQANRQPARPMENRQQRPMQSQNPYAPAHEQHQYSPPQASRQSHALAHESAGKFDMQNERSNGSSPPQGNKPSNQQQMRPNANNLELSVEPSTEGFVSVPPKSEDIVGIGIGLALDNHNNLCISSLLPGSPALRSGLLEEGDILRMVDAKDVRGMTPEAVRPLILGRSGTFVTVSVQRGNTQIVARMARARPAQNASRYIPKAGSSDAPKADKNTYSAVYSQMTAERQETGGTADRREQPRDQPREQPYAQTRKQPAPEANKAPPPDQELCGVGIVLAQNSEGELLVLSMNEGGPAARSNLIKKNDVLYVIDNVDVYKRNIDQVRPLILGIPGSTLVMGFQRPGMRRPINVRLRRGNIKTDLKQIPNPSPRPSPSATPGGGATPKQSPSQTPNATRPSSPKPQRPPKENNLVSAPPKSTAAAGEENKYGPDGPVCGLGIVLVPTPFGSLCVASITEGGPAARSGRVLRGDFVETIDGISVQDKSINDVRPLILGRAGTTVTLGLRRESEDSVIYVRVMREPVRLGEVLVPGMRVKDAQELENQKFDEPPKHASPPGARAHHEPAPMERKQAPPPPPPQSAHGNFKPANQQRDGRSTVGQSYSPATPNKNEAPKMCGVGVVLVQVSGGAVCVKSVNKGGPAYNSGKIQRGDVLFAIDGQKVLGWDVESVKPLILGPQGSTIVMSFYRVGNQVVGKRSFDVAMTRTPVDPNASLPHRPPFEVATFG